MTPLSDLYLPAALAAMVRDQHTRDVAAKERALKRRMLGGCECGEVTGETLCPWCDDETIPSDVRAFAIRAQQRARAREVVDVEAVLKALAKDPPRETIAPTGPRNRFERRRAAARARSGR